MFKIIVFFFLLAWSGMTFAFVSTFPGCYSIIKTLDGLRYNSCEEAVQAKANTNKATLPLDTEIAKLNYNSFYCCVRSASATCSVLKTALSLPDFEIIDYDCAEDSTRLTKAGSTPYKALFSGASSTSPVATSFASTPSPLPLYNCKACAAQCGLGPAPSTSQGLAPSPK